MVPFSAFALLLPFAMPVIFPQVNWRSPTRVSLLSIGVTFAGIVVFFGSDSYTPIWRPVRTLARWRTHLKSQASFILAPTYRNDILAEHRTATGDYALPMTRHEVKDATIDVISKEQGVLLVNGLNWKPRPVFQSYGAYTPFLASANAEFFRRDDAPEYLLVKIQPIGNRLPASEDGPALLEILRRYRPVFVEREFLLLKRMSPSEIGAPPDQGRIVTKKTIHFDEVVPIESSESGLTVAFQVRLLPLGRVRQLLFKLPELSITIHRAPDKWYVYRLVPRMVEDDVLLSPLLRDLDDLVAYYKSEPGERVTSFVITSDGESCYEDAIGVTIRSFPRPTKTD